MDCRREQMYGQHVSIILKQTTATHALDVQALDVLPVLLEKRDQEVD